jgi:lipopolysaccharide export LptBFGC system permease protein LptF
MEAWQLAYVAKRGGSGGLEAAEELARRTALAGSALFYALIGIPLGILTARGGRVGAFLLGIAPVLIVYLPIVVAASSLARSGRLPALPALWTGNALLLLVAAAMLPRLQRR